MQNSIELCPLEDGLESELELQKASEIHAEPMANYLSFHKNKDVNILNNQEKIEFIHHLDIETPIPRLQG